MIFFFIGLILFVGLLSSKIGGGVIIDMVNEVSFCNLFDSFCFCI